MYVCKFIRNLHICYILVNLFQCPKIYDKTEKMPNALHSKALFNSKSLFRRIQDCGLNPYKYQDFFNEKYYDN